MVIYEKLVARMNTIKTRNESRDSVLKIGLLDPKELEYLEVRGLEASFKMLHILALNDHTSFV